MRLVGPEVQIKAGDLAGACHKLLTNCAAFREKRLENRLYALGLTQA